MSRELQPYRAGLPESPFAANELTMIPQGSGKGREVEDIRRKARILEEENRQRWILETDANLLLGAAHANANSILKGAGARMLYNVDSCQDERLREFMGRVTEGQLSMLAGQMAANLQAAAEQSRRAIVGDLSPDEPKKKGWLR
jgi:hypothetical protein